jgi:signal transduction histidine kinase
VLRFTPRVDAPDKNITALADESYVDEIVMNLLQNSFDAVESRSTPSINISVTLVKDMAEIRVVDNGEGFLDSQKHLLWVPGYTTKPSGTGFGLPFIKYAAETAFKGTVECYSVPMSRTGFVVRLPAASGGK